MLVDRNGIKCAVWDSFPDAPEELLGAQADFVQCWLEPWQAEAKEWLEGRGFYFSDRFLDCRILLRNLPEKPARARFLICEGDSPMEELQKIYHAVFTRDRRMHLGRGYEQELADTVIDSYIHEAMTGQMKLLRCCYKEKLVGCAFLQETDGTMEIYLAGVLPEYQKTGAAVELYRACADFAAAASKRLLTGRISAGNTDVMNLYASLGANFYHPRDCYVRDQRGG